MELCDVVDSTGRLTGRTVARGTTLEPGEFYMVVHIWVRDERGDYLIQQRHPSLAADPGVWATTAGYVTTGEDGLTAALREVREEIGLALDPAGLRHFGRRTVESRVADIWLTRISRESAAVRMGAEVSDWRWASPGEIARMLSDGLFHKYRYFAELPG